MMRWLVTNWYKATVFAAIYSLLFIFLFILPQDFARFLIWLHVPVYLLHETEEFVYPGGFPEQMTEMFFGAGHEVPYSLMKAGFWINVPFIFLGFPFVAALATVFGLGWGMYLVYFTLVAAIPHLFQAIKSRRFYNPGMAASVFLNIPVSVFTIVWFATNNLITLAEHILGLVVAVAAMVGPMVWQLRKALNEVRAQLAH